MDKKRQIKLQEFVLQERFYLPKKIQSKKNNCYLQYRKEKKNEVTGNYVMQKFLVTENNNEIKNSYIKYG